MSLDDNPYQAPASDVTSVESVEPSDEAAAIRKSHLYYEAAVEFIGTLFVLFGGMIAIGLIAIIPFLGRPTGSALAYTALLMTAGVGLLMHRPWGRFGAIAVSSIGLIYFPIGTALGAGGLWLFLSRKGRFVTTPEYRAVIAKTPWTRSLPFVLTLWGLLLGLIFLRMFVDLARRL